LYCQTKATPFDTIANAGNIGKQCTTNGINQCLNDELRAMHNKMRLLHESTPLEFDGEVAKALQSDLNLKSNVINENTVLDLDAEIQTNCDKNVYRLEGSDQKDITTISQSAADDWYKGSKIYNPETGHMTVFDDENTKMFENFVRMMYKASTKAAFGMVKNPKDDVAYVVGYYCYDKPVTNDVAKVKANVGRYCIVDDGNGKGYNDCYNQRALTRHNERRQAHSGYVPLALDKDIARAIHALLTSEDFQGTISTQDRGDYANCGQNIFTLTDQTKQSQVSLTNMASDFWYDGKQHWNIPSGVPKVGLSDSQND
jgi:hypothetical protein